MTSPSRAPNQARASFSASETSIASVAMNRLCSLDSFSGHELAGRQVSP
jgi:hypothetical protein